MTPNPSPSVHTLYLTSVRTEDIGAEESAATRERLKTLFPKLATRRMTQLGLVVGHTLLEVAPTADDTLVYASQYGETRALEAYIDSFPTPSPTLFQTSIHPSSVQQALIFRQQPIREFFPLAGSDYLVAAALQTALTCLHGNAGLPSGSDTPNVGGALCPDSEVLSPACRRLLLCGGEERGTWLLEHGSASARTIGFTAALTREKPAAPLATLTLTHNPSPITHHLSLPIFFDHLHARTAIDQAISPSLHLTLAWH